MQDLPYGPAPKVRKEQQALRPIQARKASKALKVPKASQE